MIQVCRMLCWFLALASLLWFLFDRREHATLTVPISEWQKTENGADLWHWILPESALWLVNTKTPRRESSFLFLNDRLVPLAFPFDTVSQSEREITGWHQVRQGRLEFRLPRSSMGIDPAGGLAAEGAEAWSRRELRLEINGAMSIRRQFAWASLVLSLFGVAVCLRGESGLGFGVWPLVVLAASVPAVLPISFYLCAVQQLPISWRSSTLGIAFDRLDAVAPGLLLVYAVCGWYRDRRGTGPSGEAERLSLFVRFGWLAGLTLFLVSFTRLLSWGVGLTHPWSPVAISSPFNSAIDYSDAAGYLSGSYHLLAAGTLDEWNQRRPINAALLAFRLVLSGWSIDLAKWLQAVVVALTACWAARELARCFGCRAGMAAIALFWGCGRLFLATTLSEPLGFILGALALVGLLSQLRTGRLASGLSGAGFMTLAQAARPGALFVLPALIIAAGSWGRGWRERAIGFTLAALVVGGTMAVSPLLSRLYGTGDNLTGSNFAYTFAGLASGQSWSEVIEQYQDQLDELPNEKAVAKFLYQEGFRLIRQQPSVFVGELARGTVQFASDLPRFLIGMTSRSNIDASSPLLGFQVALMFALVVLASMRQWHCRCRQDWAMWLAIFTGLMASIPFVFLDGSMRVLMATWPAVFAWLAAGLAGPGAAAPTIVKPGFDRMSGLLAALLVGVISMTLLAPWVLYRVVGGVTAATTSSKTNSPEKIAFAAESAMGQGRLADVRVGGQLLSVDRRMRGSGIQIRRIAVGRELTPEEWQRELQMSGIGYSECLLSRMPDPPFRFDQVYDFSTGTIKILFLPGDTVEIDSGPMIVETCDGSPTFGRRLETISSDH